MILEKPLAFIFTDKKKVMAFLNSEGIDDYTKLQILENADIRKAMASQISTHQELIMFLKHTHHDTCNSMIDAIAEHPKVVNAIRTSLNKITDAEFSELMQRLSGNYNSSGMQQLKFLRLMDNKKLDEKILKDSDILQKGRLLKIESFLYLQSKYEPDVSRATRRLT
jgi:hypothetical protein